MTHKILIADDEPNIVISLEFLMQQSGYEVATARDGADAMQKIASFSPDLVLLDIMLPKLNGFEVCQRVRENSQWDRIKIVILSAKGREIEVSKGIALGADAYITKPFSTKDLIVQVQRLLQDE
ncbi:MAG: response regulator [Glaciimonas sp.]|nr:response regulator [Glaciimonas sp.]